jgi:integrative and conjugative element protein (TIGR02256 family)
MTPGQKLALEQLRSIAASSAGLLEIVSVGPYVKGTGIYADVSISCRGYPRGSGGLALRPRERVYIGIPADFPFAYPEVWTRHHRFAGFPHVQWKRHLCLYAAPAIEWNPNDGMFGFIDRLLFWLARAAQNQLDPTGAPLHPPVAYRSEGPRHVVVPRCNAPIVPPGGWFGLAQLNFVSETRVDIVGWSQTGNEDGSPEVAAAILLDRPMPFEFPETIKALLDELEARGFSRELTYLILQTAAAELRQERPLYVVIGTPMRGVQGGELLQHLSVWYLDPVIAWGLKTSIARFSSDPAIRDSGQKIDDLVRAWAESAKVGWCDVLEDRPEVTQPRDTDSPLEWCRGRTISIWGCGALGANIAEWVVRAGCSKLILRDSARVKPGILVRQPFDEADIGTSKVEALEKRLKRIRTDAFEVVAHRGDVLTTALESDDWTDGADLVIDATASGTVLEKLEARRMKTNRRAPAASIVIDSRAQRGLAVFSGATHSGGLRDVSRKAKLWACDRSELSTYTDAFWPKAPRSDLFQPEPGCSEPTFTGSSSDVAALAATLLNAVVDDLRRGMNATAHLLRSPWMEAGRLDPVARSSSWPADHVLSDSRGGYEVRISQPAWADLQAWQSKSWRCSGPTHETGGVLFGELSDACRIVWVSEALGPPPDSESSPQGFVCGVLGVAEANQEKRLRSRQSVGYVGLWHTHPGGPPLPSVTDLDGMRRIILSTAARRSRALMLIVGGASARPVAGAYVFSTADYESRRYVAMRVSGIRRVTTYTDPARIGLSLSGGGSRAIAFHLGCLRALHDRGILERTAVVSAVSGGSVIAAMYAYGREPFESFDRRVVALLRRGLVWEIARSAFASPLLLGGLGTMALSGTAAAATSAVRSLLGAGYAVTGKARPRQLEELQPPLRRWVSRTTAFEHALRDLLFRDLLLTSPRRPGLDVVLNACELRSGSAFRFGSRESGSWRYGTLRDNNVPVSHAVAASAAFPILLPALDKEYDFVDRNGEVKRRRVLLTDGGVYDNLGITCLEPGRSPEFSTNTFPVDYILCCDAGHGLFDPRPIPYWFVPRLSRSFESVFRKAVNAGQSRLHEYAASGALKGFVLSYLGQQDRQLPYLPPDLIPREEVTTYPTDFSPMSAQDLERLTRRGEQLTRLLLARYCPEL